MSVKSSKWPVILLGLLVAFGLVASAHADTWLLINGDRLTGERIGEDAQFIEVQHPQLGRLKVPRASLRQAESPAEPAETTARAARQPIPGPKPAAVENWKRQLEVGYVQQSGAKEKQDLAIRGQIEGREGDNTFRVIGRVLRSETDGQIVAERREGDFRWRHDINKRLFAQALTTYEEDVVRNIDLNIEQQLAGGFRVIDTERHKASFGVGAVVQYLQRETVAEQTALLGAFFQDYSFQLNTRLKLVQEASLMVSDRGAMGASGGTLRTPSEGSYRFKFNTGVQSKVTDALSLNVRFEYDYYRSVLESGLRADQRLTTAMGYLW